MTLARFSASVSSMPLPILFCHGLDSAPIGRKSQGLIDLGYDVRAPDCRRRNLLQRVRILTVEISRIDPKPVIVGSSFGGIAGLIASIMAIRAGAVVPALVLCAPALQLPPPPGTVDDLAPLCPTIILHGTRDDVIPIDLSRRFADEHHLELVEVDDTHGLPDAGFDALVRAVQRFAGPIEPA